MLGNIYFTIKGTKEDLKQVIEYLQGDDIGLGDYIHFPKDYETAKGQVVIEVCPDSEVQMSIDMGDFYAELVHMSPNTEFAGIADYSSINGGMQKYISDKGSDEIIELEGERCGLCGGFIDEPWECEEFDDDDQPICPKCTHGCLEDLERVFDEASNEAIKAVADNIGIEYAEKPTNDDFLAYYRENHTGEYYRGWNGFIEVIISELDNYIPE